MKTVTSPYIVVKNSRIHGKGVFAKKDIPEGTRIIEYIGEKITKAEGDRREKMQCEAAKKDKKKGSVYVYELNKKYDLDGNFPYNPARLINHTCEPNCEADIIRGRIWVIALRNIKKGEELSYNYGFDSEDYEDHPCKCGKKKCVGYVVAEEDWGDLPKKRRK